MNNSIIVENGLKHMKSRTPTIDKEIRQLMLFFPTLFATRFSVMVNIVNTSNYKWDCEKGEYIRWDSEYEHVESMDLSSYEKWVAESKDSICETNRVNSEYNLMLAKWREANIDTLSRTYCNTDHQEIYYFLNTMWEFEFTCFSLVEIEECFGFPSHSCRGCYTYRPDNITEEWRLALIDFFGKLLPCIYSYWGIFDEDKNEWGPRKTLTDNQKSFFEIVHLAKENLVSPEEKTRRENRKADFAKSLRKKTSS